MKFNFFNITLSLLVLLLECSAEEKQVRSHCETVLNIVNKAIINIIISAKHCQQSNHQHHHQRVAFFQNLTVFRGHHMIKHFLETFPIP